MRITVNLAPTECVSCAAPTSPRRDGFCSQTCANLAAGGSMLLEEPSEAEMVREAAHFAPDE